MRRGLAVGGALAALLVSAAPASAVACGRVAGARAESTAPTVTVEQPAALNPADIRGTAGTASEDTPSVTVSFYSGSEPTGDAQASSLVGVQSDGSFCIPTPWLPDGTWTVQAVQTDAAHN